MIIFLYQNSKAPKRGIVSIFFYGIVRPALLGRFQCHTDRDAKGYNTSTTASSLFHDIFMHIWLCSMHQIVSLFFYLKVEVRARGFGLGIGRFRMVSFVWL